MTPRADSADTERQAFDRAQAQAAQRRGAAIAGAIVVWALIYVATTRGFAERSLAHTLGETLGDLVLLGALLLVLTTPWTRKQREALWRKLQRRRAARGR